VSLSSVRAFEGGPAGLFDQIPREARKDHPGMSHLHLFEFEDLALYPRGLREATTLYLETVERIFGVHRLFAPKLLRVLQETGIREIVDLGSGSGGAARHAVAEAEKTLNEPVRITFTDLHPNRKAAEKVTNLGQEHLKYLSESVDASNPPPGLKGIRSMFAFFHHLRPKQAREALLRAYESGDAICVFEITDPSLPGLLSCLLMPVYVLLLTPFVRPLSVWQILFTYAIPILPLLVGWDGFVSTLRTYSPGDMERMTRDLRHGYEWEIGTLRHPWLPISFPYLVGQPVTGNC
jgi:hypothetical protein